MSRGRIHAAGEIVDTLTSPILSDAFGLALTVNKADGRYSARGSRSV